MLVWLLTELTLHSMNGVKLPMNTAFEVNNMTALAAHVLFAVLSMHWLPQVSNSTAGLRGLSVVSPKVVWASGTKGTVLRTLDGGAHWELRPVPGAEALDFRDVVAFDAKTALLTSSGNGTASRIYRTTDGGETWTLILTNSDTNGFFDAMKFWDNRHGLLLGDPVGGRFTIFTTEDGGRNWTRRTGPAAMPAEGAFAASGTCLTVMQKTNAWFGTGGVGVSRVFHSVDGGITWTVAASQMFAPVASAGIFSLVFLDLKRGVAVGGDYQKRAGNLQAVAVTADGAESWTLPAGERPSGFRSAVTYLKARKLLVTVGTNGSDYSRDAGRSWQHLSTDTLNAVAAAGDNVWAVGPKGIILKLAFSE
jgi:photosystem II stability/assembly factor-like uncharacterized protein